MSAPSNHTCRAGLPANLGRPVVRRKSQPGLHFSGNLYEGVRAWYYFGAGGTGENFNLPQRTPNSDITLSFYTRYIIAGSMPEYMNSTCIKQIKAMYQAQKNSKNTHSKDMNEFLEAESENGKAEAANFSGHGEETAKESRPRRSRSTIMKHARFHSIEVSSSQKKAHRGSDT